MCKFELRIKQSKEEEEEEEREEEGPISHHNKSTFRMVTVGEIGDIVCHADYCSIEDIMLGCQAPQVGDGLAIYVLANARSAS